MTIRKHGSASDQSVTETEQETTEVPIRRTSSVQGQEFNTGLDADERRAIIDGEG